MTDLYALMSSALMLSFSEKIHKGSNLLVKVNPVDVAVVLYLWDVFSLSSGCKSRVVSSIILT